jgi:hypothetical protein
MSTQTLSVLMPIPTRTESRWHPWPTIARAFIYEGVENAEALARLGNRSAAQVRKIRSQDKWREFREQAAAKSVAERHGMTLPFLLREQSMEGERETESTERAGRAAILRTQLGKVIEQMDKTPDKGSVEFGRLVGAAGALQSQLDTLLGLDVVKKIGTAAAIARNRAAILRPKSKYLADVPNRPHRRPEPPGPEPDVTTLCPLP